jgi:hypothetical protein
MERQLTVRSTDDHSQTNLNSLNCSASMGYTPVNMSSLHILLVDIVCQKWEDRLDLNGIKNFSGVLLQHDELLV